MTERAFSLYESLTEIHRRPRPFEVYTADILWNDDHISKQMLAFHLDQASMPASRPHEFIQRSADWISERFSLGEGSRVADFGCGPGLYTTRLAASGAAVTGIDFSRRSIEHARREAESRKLAIEYVLADYLHYRPEGKFDLITLIYCDYCPLSPDQRRQLLTKFRDLIADSGCVLLDVFTLDAFAGREESSRQDRRLMDGFWAAGDYWGFLDTFKYEDVKVMLDKYTIVEAHQTRSVYNWLQYFSLEGLKAEFDSCGLRILDVYSDVAGAAYDEGESLAVIARKL